MWSTRPPRKEIPVWIADYVLMGYGTGAIMAVPGHDERDYAFAKKFHLPIVQVVTGGDVQQAACTEDGLAVNSSNREVSLDGLSTAGAKQRIIDWLTPERARQARRAVKLRDWLFSRQRYWGEPIPIIHLEDGTMMPVPEDRAAPPASGPRKSSSPAAPPNLPWRSPGTG